MQIIIYILKCPRTGRVRYVGKTSKTLQWRLDAHLSDAQSKRLGRRGTWLRSLIRDGLKPVIELDYIVADGQSWQEIERERISFYRSVGCDLVNGTEGGEGLYEPTDEVRARMSASRKVLLATPEGKEISRRGGLKSGPLNKGKVRTIEQRVRIAAGHTGRIVSAETRAKMSASQLKRTDKRGPQSEEARRWASQRQIGKKLSAEHRAKISAGLYRWNSKDA